MTRVLGALVAGMSATLLMEYASQAIWTRQSDHPSWKFPAIANGRAAVAHLPYGLALGLMPSAGRQRP